MVKLEAGDKKFEKRKYGTRWPFFFGRKKKRLCENGKECGGVGVY